MQYLKLFHNDTEITESNPLSVGPLNASKNEVSEPLAVKLTVESGFSTYGDTTISFEGATSAKWSICDTEDGTYLETLTISDLVDATGVTFYVKAKATDDEQPCNDVSVKIKVEATIQAV
ncbi:hypothetical protein [Clostridium chrysemydis]|uniref:hypothetical protein n=1 Tax=Clostridium chrysemydis TaxID=2665504 RepID=UPI001883C505|nr:hypothetical protein [Clostridium chrysemydis]